MAEVGVSVTDIHGALARCSVLHEHCQGFKRAERPFHLELKRFLFSGVERDVSGKDCLPSGFI